MNIAARDIYNEGLVIARRADYFAANLASILPSPPLPPRMRDVTRGLVKFMGSRAKFTGYFLQVLPREMNVLRATWKCTAEHGGKMFREMSRRTSLARYAL